MEQEQKTLLIDKWFIKALIFLGLLVGYFFIVQWILDILCTYNICSLPFEVYYTGYVAFTPDGGDGGFPGWAVVANLLIKIIFVLLITFFTYYWLYKKIHQRRER